MCLLRTSLDKLTFPPFLPPSSFLSFHEYFLSTYYVPGVM